MVSAAAAIGLTVACQPPSNKEAPAAQSVSPPPAASADPTPTELTVEKQEVAPAPLRVGGDIPQPKKIYDVPISWPERDVPTTFSGSAWVGEATIAEDGTVTDLTVLHRVQIDPSWPEWEAAIADAVLQWRYEPFLLDGQPVPVIMTITVLVHYE
jgi:hypothetical protein